MEQVSESYLTEWRFSDSSSCFFLSQTHTHTQHTHLPHFSLWYLHRNFWQHLALRITAPEVESILSAAGCMGELCWYLAATAGFCEQDRRQTVSMLTDSAVSKLWGTVMKMFTFMRHLKLIIILRIVLMNYSFSLPCVIVAQCSTVCERSYWIICTVYTVYKKNCNLLQEVL